RAFYGLGYEIQAGRGRTTLGPYGLAGVGLGLSTDAGTQELAAQWSVGGGVEWRPLAWLALGAEVRYRLEDRGPRGFWNPRDDARSGVSAVLGVSLGGGGGGGAGGRAGGRGGGEYGAPPERPPPAPPATSSGNAVGVVQTPTEDAAPPD